jgi:hypothetical protein
VSVGQVNVVVVANRFVLPICSRGMQSARDGRV